MRVWNSGTRVEVVRMSRHEDPDGPRLNFPSEILSSMTPWRKPNHNVTGSFASSVHLPGR